MEILDKFSSWMQATTLLKYSSIIKYKSGINTISNEMLEMGVISKSLFDMS